MEALLHGIRPFWVWLTLACLFLAVEVLVLPSGLLLCLGTSSLLVAGLTYFAPAISWLWAVTIYSALTVASGLFWWFVLRRRAEQRKDGDPRLNRKIRQLTGHRAVLEEPVRNGRGRLRVNDSAWPVEADRDYPAGTRVEVVAVKGITLIVKAVE